MIEIFDCENFFCVKILEDISKSDFCHKNHISYKNVIADSDEFKKGDRIVINFKNQRIHIVKPAETLLSIANKYSVTEEYICNNNQIKQIFIGQQLLI